MCGGGALRAPLVRRDEGPPSSQPRNNKTIRIPVDIAPRRHSYKPQCSVTAPSIGKARLQNYQWRSTTTKSVETHDHWRLRHTKSDTHIYRLSLPDTSHPRNPFGSQIPPCLPWMTLMILVLFGRGRLKHTVVRTIAYYTCNVAATLFGVGCFLAGPPSTRYVPMLRYTSRSLRVASVQLLQRRRRVASWHVGC